ncbi:hypothetical protein L6452_35552 [Arctium lappa]|uniref:Uncharacterized protein n=1 Tax=Arctium lappa TaxID=4217 RepID=A0ACB8Y7K1_ARCLA|nr:hypothetical protein L6452_35552 [Arctium lappa]
MGIEDASVISNFSDIPGIKEWSDTSVDMEVPCLPHVVEIVPSGITCINLLVMMNKPRLNRLRISKPESVRNVAFVGHLHHGKTVFMDMLADRAVLMVDDADGVMVNTLTS